MFFSPRITDDKWPILEVGPGALPFPLSDVWMDFEFPEDQKLAQSGGSTPAKGKPLVFYTGGTFPFKDNAFKFVIASHVIEHLKWEDVPLFMSELERVAPCGYIELPRWTWELVNHIPTHLLTGDVHDGRLHLYRKTTEHNYNFFTRLLLDKSGNFREYIAKEKWLFFCKLDWRGRIPYTLHDNEYPLSGTTQDIMKLLESDCDRLLGMEQRDAPASLVQRIANNTLYRKIADRTINRFRKQIETHVRRDVLAEGMKDLLRCPLCGGMLNDAFSCSCSSFKYQVDHLTFHPVYSK